MDKLTGYMVKSMVGKTYSDTIEQRTNLDKQWGLRSGKWCKDQIFILNNWVKNHQRRNRGCMFYGCGEVI